MVYVIGPSPPPHISPEPLEYVEVNEAGERSKRSFNAYRDLQSNVENTCILRELHVSNSSLKMGLKLWPLPLTISIFNGGQDPVFRLRVHMSMDDVSKAHFNEEIVKVDLGMTADRMKRLLSRETQGVKVTSWS